MHISIVEDDPVIAKAVRTAICEAGHDCTWVADGEAAIRDNTLLSSDIVVLDLMLPKIARIAAQKEWEVKPAPHARVRTNYGFFRRS